MGFEYTPQPNVAVAASKVKGPAISLIIITALGILMQLASLVMNLAGMSQVPENMPPEMERWYAMMSGTMGVIGAVLAFAIGGLIIYGAIKMMNLQSYGLAMAAAIVAMVPCLSPCCCLGIPVGIWAIVVLNNAEVKAAFR
jgi:hypothetical protein